MNLKAVNKFTEHCNEYLGYKTLPKAIICQEYRAPTAYLKAKRVTFQSAMKIPIVIGQCFGVMPVFGVCYKDHTKLRFKFCSTRCLYSVLSILGQALMFYFCLIKLFKDSADTSLSSNTSIIYFGINCLTGILFLRLAMKWPRLSNYVAKAEAADPNLDQTLVRKCVLSCIAIIALAAVEHILAVISGISLAIDCQPDTGLFKAYVLQGFPWMWYTISYNHVVGFLSVFSDLQCAFNWNFSDTFVMCISFYLISKLEQVNNRIYAMKDKYTPSSFWKTMREDYNRLSHLVRKIDDAVSGIIFLSFANDLFFICLQLLHTIDEGVKQNPACNNKVDDRPFHGYEVGVYFVYSFSFLLLRSICMSLVAARVHTTSRKPAQMLYDVPSASYCVEVQRFIIQIHGDTVALTGLQFFNVKRGLVLTVAGTIVTYELVLMQFTGVSPTIATPTVPVATLRNP